MRGLLLTLLGLCAGVSEACRVAPSSQLIGANEQVRQASEVAVAQVIAATPLNDYEVEYRFLVLEQLAGPVRRTFTLTGWAGNNDTTFHDHRDFAFWARGGGRTMNGPDCVIHPGFAVGDSYLVFLGAAPTWRSFEKIDMVGGTVNPDDKWLAYVKAGLAGAPANGNAAPDYERVGRFIYGFHRILPQDDLDRKALAAQHAPDQLLWRVTRLMDEFDRIVRDHARVPDVQFDATLREAADVHAALQAWRGGGNR